MRERRKTQTIGNSVIGYRQVEREKRMGKKCGLIDFFHEFPAAKQVHIHTFPRNKNQEHVSVNFNTGRCSCDDRNAQNVFFCRFVWLHLVQDIKTQGYVII